MVETQLGFKYQIAKLQRNLMHQLQKLSAIAKSIEQAPSKKFVSSTIGSLIDLTRPVYRERENDYIMELKIIDDSLNDHNIFGVMIRYCSVYVVSKTESELLMANQLGDLILLKNFTFYLWNETKLETKYVGTIQGLYSFKIIKGQTLILKQLAYSTITLENVITAQLNGLHEWFLKHFKELFNPLLGVSILNNYCIMVQPFNMILALNEIKQELDTFTLILEDANGNQYLLANISINPNSLCQGAYLLIRGVQMVGNKYEIFLSRTGTLLILPAQFPQLYPSYMNYTAIHRANEKLELKAATINRYTVITQPNLKTSAIAEFIELEDRYSFKLNKEEIMISDSYLIEAVVVHYNGRVRMYHLDYQMIVEEEFLNEIPTEDKKQHIDNGRLKCIYEGQLGLMDRSNQDKGKLFYLHIFSIDQKGSFFPATSFDKLNHQIGHTSYQEARKQLEMSLKLSLQKLVDQSTFLNPVQFIIEPIKSDILLFRVINTKIA